MNQLLNGQCKKCNKAYSDCDCKNVKQKKQDIFYKKNDKRKYYIVAVLDKEETPQVVYKFYGKNKQWWHYKIEPIYDFGTRFSIGLYYRKLTGRRK